MNLGIIAHNSKKVLIEDFCIAYKNILAKHEVYATGTTGRRIEEATGLHVHKFLPGSIGGDKQFKIQQEHDHRKREYAKNHGYKLISIKYTYDTYDKIAEYLNKHLSKEIGNDILQKSA